MGHEIDVFKATDADAATLAETIRHKDKLEMIQWTANGPEFACVESLRQSDVCFAAYTKDGELLGIFGAKVDNVLEATAIIWGLSTEAANRHKIAYVANSKKVLDMIFRALPDVQEFHNWVSNDYPEAQNWVEWMGGGFSIKGTRRGFGNSIFREFYILNPYYKEDNTCA